MLRDIWVPNSLTYCPTFQESYTLIPFLAFLSTISATKLDEHSCGLWGRIIWVLSFYCEELKSGEKYSLWTIYMSSSGLTDPLGYAKVLLLWPSPSSYILEIMQKSSAPALEPLALLQATHQACWGARTPGKQESRILGVALRGEKESQWSFALENLFPQRKLYVCWAERWKGVWGTMVVLVAGMGSVDLTMCLSPAGKHALCSSGQWQGVPSEWQKSPGPENTLGNHWR